MAGGARRRGVFLAAAGGLAENQSTARAFTAWYRE
eukprot:COSAG05_NODE_14515_length_394_cov_3.088136_1_plen_34_part_10